MAADVEFTNGDAPVSEAIGILPTIPAETFFVQAERHLRRREGSVAHHQSIVDALDPSDLSRGAQLARRALRVLQEILALEREHLRVAHLLHRFERSTAIALLDVLDELSLTSPIAHQETSNAWTFLLAPDRGSDPRSR